MANDLPEFSGILACVWYGLLAWVVVLSPIWAPVLLGWVL